MDGISLRDGTLPGSELKDGSGDPTGVGASLEGMIGLSSDSEDEGDSMQASAVALPARTSAGSFLLPTHFRPAVPCDVFAVQPFQHLDVTVPLATSIHPLASDYDRSISWETAHPDSLLSGSPSGSDSDSDSGGGSGSGAIKRARIDQTGAPQGVVEKYPDKRVRTAAVANASGAQDSLAFLNSGDLQSEPQPAGSTFSEPRGETGRQKSRIDNKTNAATSASASSDKVGSVVARRGVKTVRKLSKMEEELWRQQCHRSVGKLGPLVYEPVYAVHFGRKSFGIGFGPTSDAEGKTVYDLVRVSASRDQSDLSGAVTLSFSYNGKIGLVEFRDVADIM